MLIDLVSALYDDGKWYRARVIGKVDKENFFVYYLDYGDIGIVNYVDINLLCAELMEYPVCGIRCVVNGAIDHSFMANYINHILKLRVSNLMCFMFFFWVFFFDVFFWLQFGCQ